MPNYKGERILTMNISLVDSIRLYADSISWVGNFFSYNGNLCFADQYYCTLFMFDWNSGKLVDKMLGRGHSKTEIEGLRYIYPINNVENKVAIVDNDCRLTIFNTAKKQRESTSFIVDLNNQEEKTSDYASPDVYNIMELSDFGVDLYLLSSNTILIPLSLNDRKLGIINSMRYKKGRILGDFNLKTNTIETVKGQFPHYYLDNPAPNFEHFRYVKIGEKYFVNHTVDSLIYVYNGLDTLEYTIGKEVIGADRSYTGKHYETEIEFLRDDIKRVSLNSGLLHLTNVDLLLRETVHQLLGDMPHTSIQLYDYNSGDLVAEQRFIGFIHFLHSDEKYIYAVTGTPNEEDNYQIYIFEIKHL